jgi:hypothetical protein
MEEPQSPENEGNRDVKYLNSLQTTPPKLGGESGFLLHACLLKDKIKA